jgi:DNA-binding MarR family transcriptional regulator
MFLDSGNLFATIMGAMRDVHHPPTPDLAPPSQRPDAPAGPGEIAETSALVLELIHAAHSVRDPAADVVHDGAAGGLGAHSVRAAIHLHEHGEQTIGQLARGLGVSYGWASRIASELEAAGAVQRLADPRDRRVARVALDPQATQLVERAYRWRREAIAQALEPLSPPERDAVRRFLRAAASGLTAPRDTPPADAASLSKEDAP